jgi:MFS family permease
MVLGALLSSSGGSMIWPFLTIYIRARLGVPLTVAGGLLALNAGLGLVATFIGGGLADRFGRKGLMVASLLLNGAAYLFMAQATSVGSFALLLALSGLANPLFRVGSDAMVADLIPNEERASAYSVLRISQNVGVAVGPAVGGFLAATGYNTAFYLAFAGMSAYGLLMLFFSRETLRRGEPLEAARPVTEPGYRAALSDRPFLAFVAMLTLATISSAFVWTLLSVYTKENFGIPENLYGFIPTANALMVVFLQYQVTRVTKRFNPLPVLAAGALLYALGSGSNALWQTFPGFLAGMVVLTLGELTLVPTASSYTASLAPPELRGRYMGLYNLAWGVASGVAPLLGGALSDNLAPSAIWVAGLCSGLASATGFWLLSRHSRRQASGLCPAMSEEKPAEGLASLDEEGPFPAP